MTISPAPPPPQEEGEFWVLSKPRNPQTVYPHTTPQSSSHTPATADGPRRAEPPTRRQSDTLHYIYSYTHGNVPSPSLLPAPYPIPPPHDHLFSHPASARPPHRKKRGRRALPQPSDLERESEGPHHLLVIVLLAPLLNQAAAPKGRGRVAPRRPRARARRTPLSRRRPPSPRCLIAP